MARLIGRPPLITQPGFIAIPLILIALAISDRKGTS